MKSDFDVVVVGSGAGGGVVAGELAQRGRDVLLLECGPHLRAADFTRWEAKAAHDLFWPLRFAPLPNGELVTFLAGRCVGGTTTINTKVAFRAHERDIAKWHPATGLTNGGGEPFSVTDLEPYYDRVEQVLGVRERTDWKKSVYAVEPGFHALGAELEAVHAYTDANCTSCGSCIQGCASNAGKSTMNTYIADALAKGILELRANAAVERVLVEDSEATGVEYVDDAGERHAVRAKAVVVAAGALNTPQLLIRSGLENASVGRHLGLHPVRLVYGLFDEPQDAHMVYPITAHCVKHQHDEEGGYVIEATTIQDPISFATTLADEGGPLWGPRLVEAVRRFRHWIGFLAMANDDNNSSVAVGEDGAERLEVDLPAGRARAHRQRARGSAGRCSRPRARRRSAGPVSCPPTRRAAAGWVTTRAVGRRPQRRVARREAALRRRRLARSAHAVREPVPHDHGARDAARRAPRRRPERLPRREGRGRGRRR